MAIDEFRGLSRDGLVLVTILAELRAIRELLSTPTSSLSVPPDPVAVTHPHATGLGPESDGSDFQAVEAVVRSIPDTPLPADFPAYHILTREGLNTYGDVIDYDGELSDIRGIGKATEQAILAELEQQG